MNLSPCSVLNDGMLEVMLLTAKAKFGQLVGIMDDAIKRQGVHFYRDDVTFVRGKNIRVENVNPINSKTGQKDIQRYGIDGEDLFFREFVKYETLPGELEVIMNYDFYVEQFKSFKGKE